MTSPSLHVSTPTLADIKVNNNPDSPSAGAYPPTPLTPHSTNSATTSRVDLASSSLPGNSGIHPDAAADMTNSGKVIAGHSAAERTYAPHDRTATLSNPSDMPSPDRTEQPGPNTADDQAPSGRTHQRDAEAGKEANAVGDGIGKGIGMPGIVCMPPAILPPSPPLTVADPRDEPEGPQASTSAAPLSSFVQLSTQQPPPIQTQNLDTAPPPMREEDITNWRASMGEGMASKGDGTGNADGPREQDYPRVEVVDEDGDADFDGEYDPYDLGYSPATPEGPSATSPISHSRRETFDHPLKLEVISPSPPPWEVIQPPDSAGTVIATRRVDLGHNGPKSSTSRPLIPHSAYYFGPPPIDAAYGTEPIGHIGVHHPREIIRIERDYTGGELVQFSSTYPLELEGRITPTQFIETINTINEHLITAHSLLHSFVDNALAFFTLHLSPLVLKSHYEKEMEKLKRVIDELNSTLYNPVGLNILWPRKAAFMFLEIEYY